MLIRIQTNLHEIFYFKFVFVLLEIHLKMIYTRISVLINQFLWKARVGLSREKMSVAFEWAIVLCIPQLCVHF